jgi:hypothetical protein
MTKQLLPLLLALPAFAQTSFGQTIKLDPAPNPSAQGSLQAHWGIAPDGSPLLSWVEAANGSYTLRYAVRHGAAWSEARTIVAGRRLWRHPAELPEIISLSDGTMLAHWVEKGKESSDAEDIYVSSSRDGMHWSEPAMAHHDHAPVQHGLASMVASGPHEASIFWLQALKGEDGPVSLMRTVVGADGKEIKEEGLDSDVCSCCPTSTVKTSKGLLVAYRDHTPKDIRDIAVLRFENGKWSTSKILSADNWKIDACPVNAASTSAKESRVAIAWYTEANDNPRVQIAFSSDAGTTFGKPTQVSTKDAQGYASTAITEDGAFVSWIEEGEHSATVLVRFVSSGGTAGGSAAGAAGPVLQVAQGSRQSLGYPQLLHSGNDTWIAWGDSANAKLQTARLIK